MSVAPSLAWATPALAAPAHHRQHAETPHPGASRVGDRLFPLLGNGGYDVLDYDLGVRYATDDPAQPLDGRQVYAHANKIANLCRGLPIGAMSTGSGGSATSWSRPSSRICAGASAGLNQLYADWRLDLGSYTIGQVAERLRSFLFEEKPRSVRTRRAFRSACAATPLVGLWRRCGKSTWRPTPVRRRARSWIRTVLACFGTASMKP